MVFRALITLCLIILISGCAAKRPLQKAGGSFLMEDVYLNGAKEARKDMGKLIEQNLKEEKTLGYINPYTPVIEPPVVRKVWIPDQKSEQDGSILIGGHWRYIMLSGPKWFIDNKVQDTKVPVIVPAPPQK
jgi:hypothetical protein